jgi:hypothetical protein
MLNHWPGCGIQSQLARAFANTRALFKGIPFSCFAGLSALEGKRI